MFISFYVSICSSLILTGTRGISKHLARWHLVVLVCIHELGRHSHLVVCTLFLPLRANNEYQNSLWYRHESIYFKDTIPLILVAYQTKPSRNAYVHAFVFIFDFEKLKHLSKQSPESHLVVHMYVNVLYFHFHRCYPTSYLSLHSNGVGNVWSRFCLENV